MEPRNEIVIAKAGVGVEPLIEVLGAAEHLRQEEVEQSPELVQVVLKRGSSQKKSERKKSESLFKNLHFHLFEVLISLMTTDNLDSSFLMR